MKRFLQNIAALCLLLTAGILTAQTTVQVGSATVSGATTGSNGAPIYRSSSTSTFYWSHHVTLLSAADIATAGIVSGSNITNVQWFKTTANTISTGKTATVKVYLKNTASTALTAATFTAWSGTATLMYNNAAVGPADLPNGWCTFVLSSPFNYTGGALEIGVDWSPNSPTSPFSTGSFGWNYATTTPIQSMGTSSGTSQATSLGQTMTTLARQHHMRVTWTAGAACTGTPAPGNTIASVTSFCGASTTTNLSVQNSTSGSGVTYQWQSSPNNSSWADIGGATSSGYTATVTATTYYRCNVTCAGNTGPSTGVLVTQSVASYVALPISESFETTWTSFCNTQDAPTSSWINTPATGNNSWRSDDAGATAAWGSVASGIYSPTSSVGARSARFHSYQASSGLIGTLDLYLDCSAGGASKRLTFDRRNNDGTDVLQVQLSTDGGATFPTNLTAALGSAAAWTASGNIDFTSNSATTVIRFKATSDFGSTDIGVDNVQVFEPSTIDMGASALTTPAVAGCYGAAETVTVRITNYSTTTIDFSVNPVTVNTTLSGASTVMLSAMVTTGTLAASGTLDVPMSATLDMSAIGTYTFNATTVVAGDGVATNNAMAATNRIKTAATAVPYSQAFEGGFPTAWTNGAWSVGAASHGNPSNGLYGNWDGSGDPTNVTTEKFGTMTGAESLVFDYRIVNFSSYPGTATAAGWGNIQIQVSTDCGSTFTTFHTINDANHVVQIPWVTKNISLAAYNGMDVLFKIVVTRLVGDWYLDIDNFKVSGPCTGAPNAGTTTPTSLALCPPSSGVIAASGLSAEPGVTYQWQESDDNGVGDPWANAVGGSGATSATYTTPAYATPTTIYYKMVSTCSNGGGMNETPSVAQIPPAQTYSSSTTTQGTVSAVGAGGTNLVVIGVSVVMANCGAATPLTQLDFNTNGTTNAAADILNARVFYTGTTNTFSTTTQFGSTTVAPVGAFSVAGSQALVSGTNYFWLAYDIACGATAANVIDGECNSVVIGAANTPSVQAPAGTRVITALTSYETVANGAFSAPATWACGVPTLSTIPININHIVTYDMSFATDANFTIAAGKTLNLTSTSLTVGVAAGTLRTFTNNGTLNVNTAGVLDLVNANYLVSTTLATTTAIGAGGTMTVGRTGGDARTMTIGGSSTTPVATFSVTGGVLNVNGGLLLNAQATLGLTGGTINIDPTNTDVGQASYGSHSLYIAALTHNVTGGAINFLDPPSTSGSASIYFDNASTAVDPIWAPACVVKTGGGAHQLAANTGGFYLENNVNVATLEIGTLVVDGGVYNSGGASYRQTSTRSGSGYLTRVKNMTINSGSEFIIQGSALALTGDLVNNGFMTIIPSAVNGGLNLANQTYNGGFVFVNLTTAQTISGAGLFRKALADAFDSANPKISSLAIWNTGASGVTLSTPLNVTAALRISMNGHANTDAVNKLTLGDLALANAGTIYNGDAPPAPPTVTPTPTVPASVIAYNGGWVNGTFARIVPAATTPDQRAILPVGTATTRQLAAIEFSSAPASAGTLTAKFGSGTPMGGTTINPGFDPATGFVVNGVSPSGSWDISTVDGGPLGATYTSKFYANAFTKVVSAGAGPITLPTETLLVKRPSGSTSAADWNVFGTPVNGVAAAPSIFITTTNMSGFSEFGLGGSAAALGVVLPIELKSFTARENGDVNTINWATASELNVREHVIERSADGQSNWSAIGSVASKGNTTLGFDYVLDDKTPLAISFYRLRSVDFDGSVDLSNIVAVTRQREQFGLTAVFPVPTESSVNVQFETLEEGNVQVQITDLTGRVAKIFTVSAEKGVNQTSVSLDELTAGAYLLTIQSGSAISAPARIVKQ